MKYYINAAVSHVNVDINTEIAASTRRRMSTIVRIGVATGLHCIKTVEGCAIDGIITATHLGCLEDSEKFLRNIIDNNEQLISPTAFIQSTFNTIGGQIALLSNNNTYNVTYAHRNKSFKWALSDAMTLISDGDAKNVLIVAYEETTPTKVKLLQRANLASDLEVGALAYGFVLSNQPTSNTKGWIETTDFTASELYQVFTQPID